MKKIIINADDFGISYKFNEVILDLLNRWFVKSATVMVDRIDYEKQKHQLKELFELHKSWKYSIWLHLEFLDKNFESEIRRQYDKFIDLLGFMPSHLDLHKLSFIDEAWIFIEKFCLENNMPCRNMWILSEKVSMTSRRAFSWTDKDIGIIVDWALKIEDNDIQEILFHPGKFDPECKSNLNKWRENDTENVKLFNEKFQELDIDLINYSDLVKLKK
jgi:predicted glycoside hydrolase/deacetylase ChbG (UPF0249 family)